MSQKKKAIREAFNKACLKRDGYRCRKCGTPAPPETWSAILDVHHVSDRNLMPNGGYVKENGICLCSECHTKAEEFHRTGVALSGYSVTDLYNLIGSSVEKATAASERLK